MYPMSKEKKKIIVSGAAGQLGRSFQRVHNNFELFEFVFLQRDQLDILDEKGYPILSKNSCSRVLD